MGKVILRLLGIFLILIGLAAVFITLAAGNFGGVLWFSYLSMFIIGVGLLIGSSYLIAGQLNIIIVPHIFWATDFFYSLATSNSFLGLTNYLFRYHDFLPWAVSLSHLIIVPCGIYGLYLLKIQRKDFWVFSLIQILLVYGIIKIFTGPEYNINCVFEPCLKFALIAYPAIWFIVVFFMIFITNYLLMHWKILKK